MAKRRETNRKDHCPCGAVQPLAACCGPYLDGALPPNAEALMRSRYTAYALGHVEHIRRTWAPETCPADLRLDDEQHWLGLKIRSVEAGGPGDTEGFVEFVARFKRAGRAVRLLERSRFRQVDGRWLYVSGTVPAA